MPNGQLILELSSLPPDQRAAFDAVLRRVQELEAKVATSPVGEPWDHTDKGHAYRSLCRKRVLEMLEEVPAVSWPQVRADPWFQKESAKFDPLDLGLDHPTKWAREVRHLTNGAGREDGDKSDLIMFPIPRRSTPTDFVCHREELHCAVDWALAYMGIAPKRRGGISARIYRTWGVGGDCRRCRNVV